MSLISIKNLTISFKKNQNVVNNVNIEIPKGKTVAIVGESGSGKTLSALSILKLLPENANINNGSIIFKEKDLLKLPLNEIEKIRGNKISTIFQEPMSSLNPLHTIDKQIKEMITTHNKKNFAELNASVFDLLKEVNLEDLMIRPNIYSYELSGGQRQRVMIAMSIANNPDLLIADEPTTALDVTVQQQILSLLNKIQIQRKMSILFISHDLAVVNKIADYIYVMKDGKIIEHGEKNEIFNNPKNKYTKQLVGFQNKFRKSQENKEIEILKIKDLRVWYPIKKGIFKKTVDYVKAIDAINFTLKKKETLGIVGESGSGKTSLVLAILKLIKSSGIIEFNKIDLNAIKKNKLKNIRKDIQIVFQDPFSSLSPRMNVEQILNEGIDVHFPKYSELEKKRILEDILKETGMDYDQDSNKYPHEFSGGQRQRIAIARALILKPKILILDEPTSALDVTIQNQILDLLKNLQEKYLLSYIFISHDMNVIRSVSDKILVLKTGKLVEYNDSNTVFENPLNEYTKNLISSVI
ncbi:dipeptide ABC transporter ATP-binding protein [Alphaproteobacteria bacterium]|nr:dipeptide ABC transporter ATP-binding protein [Alphaproteobacteria bacterium]